MAATSSVQPKVCTRCGQDCSATPRVRDTEGRYTCRACLDQPAQPASRPARPRVGSSAPEDAGAGNWLAASLAAKPQVLCEPCPLCSTAMTAGAVVCLGCGYNKVSGRRISTRVEKVKAPKEVRVKRPVSAAELFTPNIMALCLLALFGGLYAAAMNNPDMALLYLLSVLAVGLVAHIGLIICAAYEGAHRALFVFLFGPYALFYLCTGDVNGYVRLSGFISIVAYLLVWTL